jgi:hypothetical protein
MRMLLMLAACALAGTTVCAQYKKASFMQKSGRTYELNARGSFISKADCFQPAVAISFGREKATSRFFNWNDFELVLPTNFSYNTTYDFSSQQGEVNVPVKVSAKTATGFLYRYNLAYNLLDNSNEKNIILPFVNAGISALIHRGAKNGMYRTEPDISYETLTVTPVSHLTLAPGLNAGGGLIVRVTKWFGIKATAGYSFQPAIVDLENGGGNYDGKFFHYKSHPYASFGLRFRVATEE